MSEVLLFFKSDGVTNFGQSMESIKAILSAEGADVKSMEVGESISVEPNSRTLMPLIIELIGAGKISIGHYYSQEGDLLSDPEVSFEILDEEWIPIRFKQDPLIDRDDSDGLELHGFLEIWDRNLRRKGYVESGENRSDSLIDCPSI